MEYIDDKKFQQILTTIVVCFVIYLVYYAWNRYAEEEARKANIIAANILAARQRDREIRQSPLGWASSLLGLTAAILPVATILICDPSKPVPRKVTAATTVVNLLDKEVKRSLNSSVSDPIEAEPRAGYNPYVKW